MENDGLIATDGTYVVSWDSQTVGDGAPPETAGIDVEISAGKAFIF